MYNLTAVAKGEPYTSFTGEGNVLVKVRAITRGDDGRITSKRGVVRHADSVLEVPAFILNVYKNWDGRGELQYSFTESVIDPSSPSGLAFIGDNWTTVAGGTTEEAN